MYSSESKEKLSYKLIQVIRFYSQTYDCGCKATHTDHDAPYYQNFYDNGTINSLNLEHQDRVIEFLFKVYEISL